MKHYNPWQERFDNVCKKWEALNEQIKKEKETKEGKQNEKQNH